MISSCTTAELEKGKKKKKTPESDLYEITYLKKSLVIK